MNWRPFLLGPIFQQQGWSDSPFERPSEFPRNGLLAARIACGGRRETWLPDFVCAVYRANFAHDRDIADPTVLGEILAAVGAGAGAGSDAIEQAQTADTKLKLRDETRIAGELGIFGAPSFIARGEPFWGNDRLEQAIQWASRRESRR